MATLGTMQNGIRKSKSKSRRRNGGTTLAGAKAFAKKNGLTLSKRSNPKKKRRSKRRNGLAATPVSRRNGILGNTKSDVTRGVAVLGGGIGTKVLGRILGNLGAPYLSQVGLGNHSEIVGDAVAGLVVLPMVVKKMMPKYTNDVRLGGIVAVIADGVEKVAPNVLQGFSFNRVINDPVVINGQPMLTPQAAAAIVANTDASGADKLKVAGAMAALSSGVPVDSYSDMRVSLRPNRF